MRWVWVAVCVVGLLVSLSHDVAGQDRLIIATTRAVAPIQALTTPRKTTPVVNTDEDPVVSAKQLSDALAERLRPLERQFREDARLRSAGTLVGLGAIALGALQGQQTLVRRNAGCSHGLRSATERRSGSHGLFHRAIDRPSQL